LYDGVVLEFQNGSGRGMCLTMSLEFGVFPFN
jgi:hypothetical protein